jgi:phosphoserine phosphatase
MKDQGIRREEVAVRFYSDHVSDWPVLEWADTAIAVNPSKGLRRMAGKRGWRIVDWGF